MAQPRKRKYLLSCLLSGTILAAGMPAFGETVTPPPAPEPVKNEDLRYPGRPYQLKKLFSRCTQINTPRDAVPDGAKVLWENLQFLRNKKTITGSALTEFAAREDLLYCFKKMENGKDGDWDEHSGIIGLRRNKDFLQGYYLTTQAHETVHALQEKNGVLENNLSARIFEKQKNVMTYEAAARVSEYLVALELEKKGADTWQDNDMDFTPVGQKTLAAYLAKREKGATHKAALMAAGKAGFQEQLKEQHWLDYYNNHAILEHFIITLAFDLRKPPSQEGYSIGTARKAGYISPEFNFTADLQSLPPSTKLFGTNKRMKQAFEYIDLEHTALTLGRNDPSYVGKLARLEKKKNPFLGVDIGKVYDALRENPKDLSPLEVMSCYAGIKDCNAPGEKFFDAKKHKIRMRP